MAQTTISIRLDDDLKNEAEALCSKIGLTLSAVTNVFYRQFVRTQGIPFHVTAIEPKSQTDEAMRFGHMAAISDMTLNDINATIQGKED